MPGTTKWPVQFKPLLKKYEGKKHPLHYQNRYQLVVMVVLSAQSSDVQINGLAPALFKAFPDMSSLSKAAPENIIPYISKVRNFGNKANWLTEIGKTIKKDSNIPLTLEGLTGLPGIGRKSANVILRESGLPPEGIIVDLHVIRVAQRLGVVSDPDPKKIEKELMGILPESQWDVGMAMSFLGRDICRPKPSCEICLMNAVCAYYKANK